MCFLRSYLNLILEGRVYALLLATRQPMLALCLVTYQALKAIIDIATHVLLCGSGLRGLKSLDESYFHNPYLASLAPYLRDCVMPESRIVGIQSIPQSLQQIVGIGLALMRPPVH